jgi:hypothetical protein
MTLPKNAPPAIACRPRCRFQEGELRPRMYDSYAEQKIDQRIGFIAFPIVNIIVWAAIQLLSSQLNSLDTSLGAMRLRTAITWLPWVVNGLVLLWALIFRWHIGTGYLISFAGFAVTGIGLGLITMLVIFASTPLFALTGLIGLILFLLLLFGSGLWFLYKMFGLLRRWWAV